jgi:hypothetical protein
VVARGDGGLGRSPAQGALHGAGAARDQRRRAGEGAAARGRPGSGSARTAGSGGWRQGGAGGRKKDKKKQRRRVGDRFKLLVFGGQG